MRRRAFLFSACAVLAGGAVVGTELLLRRQPVAPVVEATGERWACPMMDYIGTHPGACPVCGMQMERMTAGDLSREQQRRMDLRTVVAALGPAVVTVRAAGAAEYDERFSTTVTARIGGRIVKRHEATFGCCQEVEAGAPIVDLYSPEAFQAQAELRAAIAAGDGRLAKVIEERFARWNLAHVAAAIRAGVEPVDTVEIRSPVAGQAFLDDQAMVNTALMVGTEVRPDAPLLKLVDPSRLTLVVHVPETKARFLRENQPVILTSDELGDLPEVKAVVGRVSNEINPLIRAREVRIYLNDGRKKLLPGSLVTVRVRGVLTADLGPADPADEATWGRFVLIPKEAVLSTGVRHVAWRAAERTDSGAQRFELAQLALGPRIEGDDGVDRFIVRAGLQAGDEVAARGAFLIDSQAQLAGSPSLLFPDGAVQRSAVPASAPAASAHDGHVH